MSVWLVPPSCLRPFALRPSSEMARASRTIVERRTEAEGNYQLELIRCGKVACKRCKRRPAHGPYWYLYQWQPAQGSRAARLRSTYVGKSFQRRIA